MFGESGGIQYIKADSEATLKSYNPMKSSDALLLDILKTAETLLECGEFWTYCAEHIAEDGSMLYVRQVVKMVKDTAVIGNTKSSDGIRDVPVPSSARGSALYLRQQAGEFVWDSRSRVSQ